MTRAEPLRLTIAAFALGIAMPLAAQDNVAPADPRLQIITFDEAQVFTISGKVKVQTTIKFAPDEAIENVAVGDSNAWQIQPNKAQTILFVKPLEPAARTNMTVVTNRRTYLFDLVASPRNAPLYVLQFRYPELERAEAEARLAAAEEAQREQANPAELAAANDPYAVADPAQLNFEWARAGESELLPARAYDDGEAVFLTWPADTAIPAILITNADGDEGPINFTVRGDTIVLDSVPGQIILRSGAESATLTNTGPARALSAAAGQRAFRGS
ncbi:MAG: TrbG/VirB9 family P-type conjugative transfer protein [Erythrobacter sp.]|jgi:type IV secretion system protein VirB9|nr:TrbG/VirB9 family P-type conjugative transfer protein [Erythrobacter sp.]